jgi:long-chain acyl-CoA synthetase
MTDKRFWLKNYPKGVRADIDPSLYSSLNEIYNECFKRYRDHSAYECMGSDLTFEELNELADDFASFLQIRGLKKGDRIAIQMPNVFQYPIVLVAALRIGLVVVNTNPLYTAREMKHQFKDSGAKAIVILSHCAHLLEDILSETDIETVVVTSVGDMLGFPKSILVNAVVKYVKKMAPDYNLPGSLSFYQALDIGETSSHTPVEVGPEDLAFLQYTGGTTGVAKGAMLTHRNIIANVLQIREWLGAELKPGAEIAICALPLYHIFSLTVNAIALTTLGATNIMITNPRDIPNFVKTLKKYRFTLLTGLNTLLNALMNNPQFKEIDFSSLKISVAGGMALQRNVAERWLQITKTPVFEGYGLTETSPLACVNPIDGNDRPGTIGLPVSSTWIKLVNDDDVEVPIGEPGEICIKGPQVMRGYWKQPQETAKVLSADGWFKSGDVGVFDSDGFVKIVDRKKDMILVSGFNVYPNEIEEVVASYPKVLECAAIGVPDAKSTEAVKIFVVPRDPSLTETELLDFCRKNLTGYKMPKHIEFRTELPKTPVGKILRRALRDQATVASSSQPG